MKYLKYILIVTLFAFLLISCSENNPVEPEDHFQPEGWLFIDGASIRIMQIFRGKFKQDSDTLFYVPFGEDTDHISIKFFDAEGKEIEPPTDTQKSLSWEINDTTVVDLERHDGEEWEFHLFGKKKDTTSIQFFVMHNGHNDVRSGFIKIKVD